MADKGGIDRGLRDMVARMEASMAGAGDPLSELPPGAPSVGVPEMLRMLEADLADEIKAVATYDAHIESSPDPTVKSVLGHIRDEEMQHAEELRRLIASLQSGEAL